jgi:hypothetical protein
VEELEGVAAELNLDRAQQIEKRSSNRIASDAKIGIAKSREGCRQIAREREGKGKREKTWGSNINTHVTS